MILTKGGLWVPPRAVATRREAVQHVYTFVSQYALFMGQYRNADEAYRNNRQMQSLMRKDPVIMEPLTARRLAVALLPWSIEPEDEDDPTQKFVCENLTKCLNASRGFFRLLYALTDAIWYGHYGTNQVYQVERGRYVIRRWQPIHGDKLVFPYDDAGDGVGIMVSGLPAGEDTVIGWESRVLWVNDPALRKTLAIHKHDIEDAEFWTPDNAGSVNGVGLRVRTFWPWYLKQNTLQQVADWVQRWSTGSTIAYYDDSNPSAEAAMRTAIEQFQSAANVLVPRSGSADIREDRNAIEHIEHGTGGAQFAIDFLNEYLGNQIKRMIVGQTATSEGTPGSGLNANAADAQEGTFSRINSYDARNLEETVTHEVLWPLAELEHPGIDWTPRFRLAASKPDPEKLLKAARDFIELGGEVGENLLREAIGLAEPKPGEKRLTRQAAAVPGQMPAGGSAGTPGGMGSPGDVMADPAGAPAADPLASLMGDDGDGEAAGGGLDVDGWLNALGIDAADGEGETGDDASDGEPDVDGFLSDLMGDDDDGEDDPDRFGFRYTNSKGNIGYASRLEDVPAAFRSSAEQTGADRKVQYSPNEPNPSREEAFALAAKATNLLYDSMQSEVQFPTKKFYNDYAAMSADVGGGTSMDEAVSKKARAIKAAAHYLRSAADRTNQADTPLHKVAAKLTALASAAAVAAAKHRELHPRLLAAKGPEKKELATEHHKAMLLLDKATEQASNLMEPVADGGKLGSAPFFDSPAMELEREDSKTEAAQRRSTRIQLGMASRAKSLLEAKAKESPEMAAKVEEIRKLPGLIRYDTFRGFFAGDAKKDELLREVLPRKEMEAEYDAAAEEGRRIEGQRQFAGQLDASRRASRNQEADQPDRHGWRYTTKSGRTAYAATREKVPAHARAEAVETGKGKAKPSGDGTAAKPEPKDRVTAVIDALADVDEGQKAKLLAKLQRMTVAELAAAMAARGIKADAKLLKSKMVELLTAGKPPEVVAKPEPKGTKEPKAETPKLKPEQPAKKAEPAAGGPEAPDRNAETQAKLVGLLEASSAGEIAAGQAEAAQINELRRRIAAAPQELADAKRQRDELAAGPDSPMKGMVLMAADMRIKSIESRQSLDELELKLKLKTQAGVNAINADPARFAAVKPAPAARQRDREKMWAAAGVKAKLAAYSTGDAMAKQLAGMDEKAVANAAKLAARLSEAVEMTKSYRAMLAGTAKATLPRATIERKLKDLAARGPKLQEEVRKANEAAGRVFSAMELHPEEQAGFQLADATPTDEVKVPGQPLKDRAADVVGRLSKLVAGRDWSRGGEGSDRPWADPFTFRIGQSFDGRAFNDNGTLAMDVNSADTVYGHEIGHTLEGGTYGGPALAAEFVRSRFAGDAKPDKLSKLTGNRGYGDSEVSYGEDDFAKTLRACGFTAPAAKAAAAYTAKVYPNGMTEVVSIGVECMMRNPVAFAKSDPEWFKLTLGFMRGDMR